MRRRRQKNPLLGRILLISVVVNMGLLVVLAHFGTFRKIQERFIQTQMVVLPPAEKIKEEHKVAKVAHKAPVTPHRTASHASHVQQAARRSNLNTPKLALANGGHGGDGGPAVEQGQGKAGEVPTVKATTKPPVAQAPPVQPPQPPQVTTPQPPPVVKPPPPPKEEAVPTRESPKPPVVTEATAVNSPQPSIPDDLRQDAIDKSVVIEFTVEQDGSLSDMRVLTSSGVSELDRIGLDTARQYKFKPAESNGQPIASRVRLHIEFQVS